MLKSYTSVMLQIALYDGDVCVCMCVSDSYAILKHVFMYSMNRYAIYICKYVLV